MENKEIKEIRDYQPETIELVDTSKIVEYNKNIKELFDLDCERENFSINNFFKENICFDIIKKSIPIILSYSKDYTKGLKLTKDRILKKPSYGCNHREISFSDKEIFSYLISVKDNPDFSKSFQNRLKALENNFGSKLEFLHSNRIDLEISVPDNKIKIDNFDLRCQSLTDNASYYGISQLDKLYYYCNYKNTINYLKSEYIKRYSELKSDFNSRIEKFKTEIRDYLLLRKI